MINREKLNEVIKEYKKDFISLQWDKEKYKWEAIKHFQDHWDINASNFGEMFMKSTEKAGNLLTSRNNFPRGMIKEFSDADVEATRAMFINLYNESKDINERLETFRSNAEALRVKCGEDIWKQHYQKLNPISTYLWLRYPDKYYIYKHTVCGAVAKELNSDFIPKRGKSSHNFTGAFKLYNEICEELKLDNELVTLLKSVLTDSTYPDTSLKTLTIDVGYYISTVYKKKSEWFPSDYSPKITAEKWLELLKDRSIFTKSSLEIINRFKDFGGMATCKQLSTKYGETYNFYNSGSTSLAKRVAKATNCPIMENDTENSQWWPILYVGKKAEKGMEGSYIWKLRDDLLEALERYDLSEVELFASEIPNTNTGYWWLLANPKIWSFSEVEIGETRSYTLYSENGNKRRIHQNFLDAKVGDFIIGYESSPVKKIVALAKVSEGNDDDRIYFDKTEGLSMPIDYSLLRSCPELEKMEFFSTPQGSLFKLTEDEYNFIMDLIREENPIFKASVNEAYSKDDFLHEVYMGGEQFDTLESLLKNKKNLILQGAPGVGKTFASKRLAYAIMKEKDESRIELIQFHQNYSYEDFIMGYRPVGEGFELQNGIFYSFCQKAANMPNKPFFFIIDEINRGNMSKVFGELLMLVEKDYRGTKATLAYNGLPFSVPKNLYIIGMMNTADRSLAMIDYALRRRFSFFEMEPGFNSDGFKKYQASLDNDTFNNLIEKIKDLNKVISADSSLGKGFSVGHSYFCGGMECTDEWMIEVVEYDILPMLSEYWFDEETKLQEWQNILRGVFND